MSTKPSGKLGRFSNNVRRGNEPQTTDVIALRKALSNEAFNGATLPSQFRRVEPGCIVQDKRIDRPFCLE